MRFRAAEDDAVMSWVYLYEGIETIKRILLLNSLGNV